MGIDKKEKEVYKYKYRPTVGRIKRARNTELKKELGKRNKEEK